CYALRVQARIKGPRPGGILRSDVGVDVELLAVILQRGQTLKVFDETNASVGIDGEIGELGRAVTAHAAAAEAMQAEEFVVPKTGIKSDFRDEIRRRISCVIGGCVVAVARARLAEQVIGNVAVGGERALRVFNGERDRHFIAEVFRQAKPVLARESESDVIPRIDGRGSGVVDSAGIVAGRDSRLVFGDQAPRLAAEEFPAIVKLRLSPSLPETESVAVGLRGGRGDAGGQEVGRYVAG